MKLRIYLFIIIFFLSLNQIQPQEKKVPKVGLVLSGGGAKGFAHIGVIELLEKEGIPIDIIVGTSIGSIIGGLYSIGYNSSQLKDIALNENWTHLLSDYIPRGYKNIHEKYDQDRYLVSFNLKPDEGISLPAGVIEGHNILNRLCELTAKYHEVYDFDKLPIPFACVAADLETDEEIVMRHGFLPEAMFASMSIPTVFSPSQVEDKMVVDGGIVNNFPADIAKLMGADIIIGIDIQTKPLTRNEISDIMDVVSQMISYMGFEKYIETRKLCDVIVEPNISGYDIASFSNEAADSLIRRGYNAASKKIEEIKILLDKNKVHLQFNDRKYEYDEEFHLNNFMVEGMGDLSIDYLLDKSDLNFPNKYTFLTIHEGINRLYGSNNFKKTYFKILNSNDKTLRLIVNEKNTSTMNAGFNFNSTDKAAILLNLTLKNEILKSTRLSLDAKLSTNTMFGASFQFYIKSLPEIDLSSLYKNFNVEIFERNKKISEADVRYFRNSISLSEIFGSNYLLDFGLRTEYYKFNPFSSDEVDTTFSLKENTILSLYGKIRFDNLDDKYYPTGGFDLNAEFSYASNEANNIIENTTTPILNYNLKTAISITKNICFLPTFYGRFLLNNNSEIFRNNVMGGSEVTKLLDYHLPFIGVSRVIFIKDKAMVTKLELRTKLSTNNYISLIVNGATHFNKFADWKTRELIGGYGINYSYNSFIGPIDFLISTSDYTKRFNIFVNVGRWF